MTSRPILGPPEGVKVLNRNIKGIRLGEKNLLKNYSANELMIK